MKGFLSPVHAPSSQTYIYQKKKMISFFFLVLTEKMMMMMKMKKIFQLIQNDKIPMYVVVVTASGQRRGFTTE